MNRRYLEYLYSLIGGKDDYELLLRQLYKLEFFSIVGNDDNRGEDGTILRDNYCDREGLKALPLWLNGPCRVLEMLIALAYRFENLLSQGPHEHSVGDCFWEMIQNLDLDWITDEVYLEDEAKRIFIDDKIDKLLSRKYGRDGKGGLFPIKNTKNDQRNVEIWYQMSEYVLENYQL